MCNLSYFRVFFLNKFFMTFAGKYGGTDAPFVPVAVTCSSALFLFCCCKNNIQNTAMQKPMETKMKEIVILLQKQGTSRWLPSWDNHNYSYTSGQFFSYAFLLFLLKGSQLCFNVLKLIDIGRSSYYYQSDMNSLHMQYVTTYLYKW